MGPLRDTAAAFFVRRTRAQTLEQRSRPISKSSVEVPGLKVKRIASTVAISALHRPKRFMEIGETDFTPLVAGPVLMALTDGRASKSSKH